MPSWSSLRDPYEDDYIDAFDEDYDYHRPEHKTTDGRVMRFRTNDDASSRKFWEQAAKELNVYIEISDEACDCHGRPIKDYIAIYEETGIPEEIKVYKRVQELEKIDEVLRMPEFEKWKGLINREPPTPEEIPHLGNRELDLG